MEDMRKEFLMFKKLLILFSVIFFGIQIAQAYDFDSIKENEQAVYSTQAKIWTKGGMTDDRIVLTKKMSPGSGGYSEYYYNDGKIAVPLTSNFEFLFDGKLITVNNADLEFNEIVYENGIFSEQPLPVEEIQKIFHDVEIVKISQFENGEITIKKGWFKEKTVLLLNDTDLTFYKYSYRPDNSIKNPYITGLITLKKRGKITFSHYGDKEDMLTIYVKN